MDNVHCPALINAAAEGIGCGDFALDHLQKGDQVKVLCPIALDTSHPQNRVALWVRIREIVTHPLPDRHLFTATIEEVIDLGETGLQKGQLIRFGRCNIAEVA